MADPGGASHEQRGGRSVMGHQLPYWGLRLGLRGPMDTHACPQGQSKMQAAAQPLHKPGLQLSRAVPTKRR